jgi:hypothetical protein
LNIQDAELDNEPDDQVHSPSSCLNATSVSIKEDCHAHHRAASA